MTRKEDANGSVGKYYLFLTKLFISMSLQAVRFEQQLTHDKVVVLFIVKKLLMILGQPKEVPLERFLFKNCNKSRSFSVFLLFLGVNFFFNRKLVAVIQSTWNEPFSMYRLYIYFKFTSQPSKLYTIATTLQTTYPKWFITRFQENHHFFSYHVDLDSYQLTSTDFLKMYSKDFQLNALFSIFFNVTFSSVGYTNILNSNIFNLYC